MYNPPTMVIIFVLFLSNVNFGQVKEKSHFFDAPKTYVIIASY